MGEKETEQRAAREERRGEKGWRGGGAVRDEEEGDKLTESERKGVRGGGAQR